MIRTRRVAFALAAVLLVIAGGCEKDEENRPAPQNDTFTGLWVGTWSATTQVDWASGGGCPSDTVMTTFLVIQEGDEIKDVLSALAPPSLQGYVQYLQCGMDLDGDGIDFSCGLVTTLGGCLVSTSSDGSGAAGASTFTITMDASLQVQGGPECSPEECSFNAVTNATRVSMRTTGRDLRYN